MKKVLILLTILTLVFAIPCFAIPSTVEVNIDQIDESYTFTSEEFINSFQVPTEDNLSRIVIVTLPEETAGKLLYNGENITTLPFGIDVANISKLTFVPAENFVGETTFTWRGKTPTVNSQTIYEAKITVTDSYKDKLVRIDVYKNELYTFKKEDFNDIFRTLDKGDMTRLVIVSLPDPANGELLYNDTEITTLPLGIDVSNISKLTFIPAEDFEGFTTFTWRGKTETENDQTIFITKLNVIERPQMIALDKSLTTDENTLLSSKVDTKYADNSNIIIVTQPKNGLIEKLNTQTGEFQYVPYKNYVGTDSFTFKAVRGEDETFEESNIATVTITINEDEDVIPFHYVDMQSNWANYSASHLADMGIMVGENYNGQYFFRPDVKVTRADFVISMLSVLNIKPQEEKKTFFTFADDDDIEDWLKPYVYTAYDKGIIKGSLENNKIYFLPDNNISRAEAATIINNSIELLNDNTQDLTFTDSKDIPSWSLGAIKNMVGYQIINGYEDKTFKPSTNITRAELAEMLYKTIKEKQNQEELAQKEIVE